MSERDSTIDAVRAFAMVGVVGGHWLVTGLVVDHDGVLRQVSPLASMSWFAPLSWVLQTLGLFFFAGGFAAARKAHRSRLLPPKLTKPVALLTGGWAVALGIAAAAGVPFGTLRTVGLLVVSPLWFLLPYLALSALTGPLTRLVDRTGPAVALAGVAVVTLSDLGLAPVWLAVPAAWSVPWVLGVALGRRRLGGARTGWWLALTGAIGLAFLINVARYPASAVGVPGDGRSNLDPPSLFAIALAAVQIGLFLIVREPLRRYADRPLIAGLNRATLPIYLSHQSVLVVVAAAVALVVPHAPGLLSAPGHPSWALQRLAWLPVLAAVLTPVARFRIARTGGTRHLGRAPVH